MRCPLHVPDRVGDDTLSVYLFQFWSRNQISTLNKKYNTIIIQQGETWMQKTRTLHFEKLRHFVFQLLNTWTLWTWVKSILLLLWIKKLYSQQFSWYRTKNAKTSVDAANERALGSLDPGKSRIILRYEVRSLTKRLFPRFESVTSMSQNSNFNLIDAVNITTKWCYFR